MAETSKGPLLTRREFLERAVVAGILAVTGGSLGRAILSVLSEEPTSSRAAISGIEKPQVEVDERAVVDLAKILAAGRAKIEKPPRGKTVEQNNALNEILYRQRAEEMLKFLKVIEPELGKIKPRLAAMARFTDFGETPPPQPPKVVTMSPEDSSKLPQDYFLSGHFGPQEFLNVGHNRLIRLNLALILALGLAENEKTSQPFSRLFSTSWQDRWDWLNAHLGRDILRWVTGITNSQKFVYGPNSRGGVFATEETLYSEDLGDRLVVMLGPGIMTLRGYRTTRWDDEKIYDFAAIDADGNPDWAFLNRWNSTDTFLQAKIRQNYDGFKEFFAKHREFGWVMSESIV